MRHLVLLLTGCTLIGDDALAERKDPDGDGVAWPDDCDDADPDVGAPIAWHSDGDGDGWGVAAATLACAAPPGTVAADGDCDDADAAVHPGAAEVCGGTTDRDCDGTPGPADADGDGANACLDCDDADATRVPGAPEVCDGVDQDCDEEVDEDPEDGAIVYADADGDGWGDEQSPLLACGVPAGTAADAGDCDDADAAAHPGAEEICDGDDDDCDGAIDEDTTVTIHADEDGDGFGDPASAREACGLASGWVYDASDCDDTDADTRPNGTEACDDGRDQDCDGTGSGCSVTGTASLSAATRWDGGSGDGAGWAVAGVGDVDGDGAADLLVGGPYDDGGGVDAGAAWLVAGGTAAGGLGTRAVATFVGEDPYDAAGVAVAGGGDLDGDGLPDLLVGAPDHGGGALYVWLGRAAGTAGTVDLASASAILEGATSGDDLGRAAAGAGDLDGDGLGDLLVGAPGSDLGGTSSGAVWVVGGSPESGALGAAMGLAVLVGPAGERAGSAVASVGDVDGDGLAESAVGAPYADAGGADAGAVYLVGGSARGTVDLAVDADTTLVGEDAGDLAGWAVAGAGDVDGDGHADVLLGAFLNDRSGADAGAAYLALGPAAGTLDLADADAILQGDAPGDYVGRAVAGAGDVDGNGTPDLLLGAPGQDGGGAASGAAYLFLTPVTGGWTMAVAEAARVGAAAGDQAGFAVAGPGDVDGDGLPDLLVGAWDAGHAGAGAGAVYLLAGTGTW